MGLRFQCDKCHGISTIIEVIEIIYDMGGPAIHVKITCSDPYCGDSWYGVKPIYRSARAAFMGEQREEKTAR